MTRSKDSKGIILRTEVAKLFDRIYIESEKIGENLTFNAFVNNSLGKLLPIIQDYTSLHKSVQQFYLDWCHYNYIKMSELCGDNGTSFELALANDLIVRLFTNAKEYSGTTIYPPHNHYFYFPNLLTRHETLIKKYNTTSNRFVIIKRPLLYASYKYHNDKFRKFCEWHRNHKVGLYAISPEFAEIQRQEVNKKYGPDILRSVNLASWKDHCAMQCDLTPPPFISVKPADKERRIQLVFPNNITYQAIEEYIGILSNQIKDELNLPSATSFNIITFLEKLQEREIPEQDFTKSVANVWSSIEGKNRIWKSANFLNEIIQRHYGKYITNDNRIKILSAAGTLGQESLVLGSEGYSVTYNEPRKHLYDVALRELETYGDVESVPEHLINGAEKRFLPDDNKLVLRFKSSQNNSSRSIHNKPSNFSRINNDMKSMFLFNEPLCYLEDLFCGDAGFDVVLLTGNYISVYKEKSTINTILSILRKAIKPGGILIIDHRNFEKIEFCFSIANNMGLSAREIYLNPALEKKIQEKWSKFRSYKSEYIYTGIPFGPIDLLIREPEDFNRVTMELNMPNESESFKPILTSIKWKEFREMLGRAGFINILSFGDQEISEDLDPGKDRNLLKYDFISHVGTNP
ncbi:MAG TPA: hypothetical protein VH796_02530 [Nitrososphaeraceae archaeon]